MPSIGIQVKEKKKKIGTFNNVSTFSFQAIKHLTSVDGGCIIFSNKKISDQLQIHYMESHHGISLDCMLQNLYHENLQILQAELVLHHQVRY